ncbi:hypothetical protein RMSM_03141 [Rhodopirellula maiorica SM1]|uniref:Uncharacterized protein n=1 Tax=Rhodopirellula maiorica SM1 TaxID=1265738 RepID=M5S171_9BACT|nr:hypothetical protein [Rhodopirellula maiorica]EMI19924.1 hypothetical protein RMSM_03141 [Rhodopirellula maiorica SM1]
MTEPYDTPDQDAAPEILEAHWELEQVFQLFDDLSQGANVQHVQVRTASGGRAQDQSVTLLEAKELLKNGDARAIQIRYTFEAQDWCDTLMVKSDEVHIIRTRV